jgi:hypothetical protein
MRSIVASKTVAAVQPINSVIIGVYGARIRRVRVRQRRTRSSRLALARKLREVAYLWLAAPEGSSSRKMAADFLKEESLIFPNWITLIYPGTAASLFHRQGTCLRCAARASEF